MRAIFTRRRGRNGHDGGATAVEYAILAGFIAVVIAIMVMALGLATRGHYGRSTQCFEPAESGSDPCLGGS